MSEENTRLRKNTLSAEDSAAGDESAGGRNVPQVGRNLPARGRVQEEEKPEKEKMDWIAMVVPLVGVTALSIVFMVSPAQSKMLLTVVRSFLGDEAGLYYAILGYEILACSMYVAFSKYGKIRLGTCRAGKPLRRSCSAGGPPIRRCWKKTGYRP